MKLKEKISSLFEEKELSPEEVAGNIKEIEEYLLTIPKDLLEKYKESTGENYIKIFWKERKENEKYFQSEKLVAVITPENTINLTLDRFWHYDTWTFRYVSKWNENSDKHINDFEVVIGENQTWKKQISHFKNSILGLKKKLHSKIRNQKIIKPIKQAIGKVFKTEKKENI